MKRKKLIIPLPILIGVAVVMLGGVGVVGALNGWFGGGSSILEDTMTRGLVGYWNFDEGSGRVAHDASGYANNGTASSTWATGKVGSAGQFDGVDDYVVISQTPSLDNLFPYTMELWIKPLSLADWRWTIGRTTGGMPYALVYMSSGIIYHRRNFDTTPADGYSTSQLAVNTWTHLVITLDTDKLPRYYFNGVESGYTSRNQGVGNPTADAGPTLIGTRADYTYNANALIDEVRIYNRALSPAEIRYHYNRGGPVAQWKFDEGSGSTAYDSTENNNDGTIPNSTQMATSTSGSSGWVAGKYGTALAFDGVDDYVNAGSGSSLNITSAITVEAWVKMSSMTNIRPIVQRGSNDYSAESWIFETNPTYSRFVIGQNFVTDDDRYGLTALSQDVWYHLVVTWQGSTKALDFYLNGRSDGKYTTASGTLPTGSYSVFIGRRGGASFDGSIDDVRIYNYVRTPEEVRLDYNAGFAAHFGPQSSCDDDPGACMTEGLVGYWDMEEGTGTTIHDRSGSSNNGTTTNMTTPWTSGIVPLSGGKKGGGALSFDGTDDYVDIGAAKFDTITDGTIEAWFKHSGTNGANRIIFSHLKDGGNRSPIFIGEVTQKIAFEIIIGGVVHDVYSDNTVAAGSWYHLVVTFGASGMKMFVNGVQQTDIDLITWSFNDMGASTENRLGIHAGGSPYNGIIDEARVYNRALSAEEIRYHYNRGGPVAQWKLDEGSGSTAYDSTENNNDGTIPNSTQMATSTSGSSGWVAGKYGTALAFDGVDDYVSVADNSTLLPSTEITMEAWIRPEGPTVSWPSIISKDNAAYTLQTCEPDLPSGTSVSFWLGSEGNGSTCFPEAKIYYGNWYHVVVTYDGNTARQYHNGKLIYSQKFTATMNSATALLIGGYPSSGNRWNGLIDDVRIYNYARTPEEVRLDYNAGLAAHFGPQSSCDDDPGACMTQGLVGYWAMDEGSGSLAYDTSNYANNGTLAGPSWTKGKVGGGLSFDGGDKVSIPIALSPPYTLTLWGKLNILPSVLVAQEFFTDGSVANQAAFGYDGTNQLYFNNGSNFFWGTPSTPLSWHMYTVVVNGANSIIYLDGGTPVTGTLANTSITTLLLGENGNASVHLTGVMDEVRVYNRALSAEEVRYQYNKGGPVAQWKMDEGEGRTVYDSTNNNNDGTLILAGSATSSAWVGGKYGSALSFDGVDDYVEVPDSPSLNPTTAITIELWVNLNIYPWTGRGAIAKGWDVQYEIGCGREIDSGLGFLVKTDVFSTLGFSDYLPANQWSHLAGTYSASEGQMKLYLNGKLDGQKAKTGNIAVTANTITIGRMDGSSSYFPGLIDDVRIYNYARNSEQIRQDYNAGLSAHFK